MNERLSDRRGSESEFPEILETKNIIVFSSARCFVFDFLSTTSDLSYFVSFEGDFRYGDPFSLVKPRQVEFLSVTQEPSLSFPELGRRYDNFRFNAYYLPEVETKSEAAVE